MVSDSGLVERIAAREISNNAAGAEQIRDLLEFVDRARRAGERVGGVEVGRLEQSAAAHELSMALTIPVAVIERRLAAARRVRSRSPLTWTAWTDGTLSLPKAGHRRCRDRIEAHRIADGPR